jgi:hypothetical protein
MNKYYLVDRKERQLNLYFNSGKASANKFNGISLPIFKRICQLSRYESLHGTR